MSLPHHFRADDPAAADPARRRLLQKSSHFPRPKPASPIPRPRPAPDLPSSDLPIDDIHIDDHLPLPSHNKDIYRWAVVYENQRGITLFSTPFYSPLSLLPSDPQPFTVPNTHTPRKHLPNLSLENYPLPDGTWRWVSFAWMIDMRSDLGEVQPDGFEYNWLFRDTHWHANIGKLSAGAWVRRRRWIRLMMRPANHSHLHFTPTPISRSPSPPPSQLSLVEDHHLSHVWNGSEQDWQHVHRLLRQLGRDGRKLELWRLWLSPFAPSNVKAKGKQSDPSSQNPLQNPLSDVVPEGNPPPLPHLITILQNHGDAILHSFVFPDSRAQFLHLVRQAGLAEDLERCLGRVLSPADVDFWSYADNLDKL